MPVLSPIPDSTRALRQWVNNNVLVPGVDLERSAAAAGVIDVSCWLRAARGGPIRGAWPVQWFISDSEASEALTTSGTLTVSFPSSGRAIESITANKEGIALPDRRTGRLDIRVASTINSTSLYPNGDSTPLDWDVTPVGTHYTAIDDWTGGGATNDADFIDTIDAPENDTFDLSASPADFANSVDISVVLRVKSDQISEDINVGLIVNSVPYILSGVDISPYGTFTTITLDYDTWDDKMTTKAIADASKLRIQSISGGWDHGWISAAKVDVDYMLPPSAWLHVIPFGGREAAIYLPFT